jgi:RNA polymerase sigma factor (sigma-70 family)
VQLREGGSVDAHDRVDDGALLIAAASGDQPAFDCFYRRWLPVVTRYHLRRVGSRELAFDLTAETFAAVVVGLDGFDPRRGSAAGWLFAIAEHKLRSSLRRGQVEARARRSLGHRRLELDDQDLARVDELASLGGATQLEKLLAELPDAQEQAVRARVLDERSYADIASALRCSEAVVRQRVHRGLERLRERLAEVS